MIEFSLYTYLSTDSTLQTLLSGGASDKKIYPLEAFQPVSDSPALPFLVYNVAGIGGVEELMREIRINIKVCADNFEDVKNISEQLLALLDLEDEIQGAWRPTDYYLYYCKQNGGGDLPAEFVSRNEYVRVLSFDMKYLKKT